MITNNYVIHITTAGDVDAVSMYNKNPTLSELEWLTDSRDVITRPATYGVLVVGNDAETGELPLNDIATAMLRSDIKDYICGDAVLCAQSGNKLLGFDRARAERIIRALKEEVSA